MLFRCLWGIVILQTAFSAGGLEMDNDESVVTALLLCAEEGSDSCLKELNRYLTTMVEGNNTNASGYTWHPSLFNVHPPTPSPTMHPTAVSCSDQRKDGSETDVDCGGTCHPCALGKKCKVAGDCYSGNCAYTPMPFKTCETAAPTPTPTHAPTVYPTSVSTPVLVPLVVVAASVTFEGMTVTQATSELFQTSFRETIADAARSYVAASAVRLTRIRVKHLRLLGLRTPPLHFQQLRLLSVQESPSSPLQINFEIGLQSESVAAEVCLYSRKFALY